MTLKLFDSGGKNISVLIPFLFKNNNCSLSKLWTIDFDSHFISRIIELPWTYPYIKANDPKSGFHTCHRMHISPRMFSPEFQWASPTQNLYHLHCHLHDLLIISDFWAIFHSGFQALRAEGFSLESRRT